MAPLLVLANVPHRRPKLGAAMPAAMEVLGPLLHPALGEYWSEAVPELH